MSVTIDRGNARAGARMSQPSRNGGPVVIATFAGAPFGARAARLAVETAAELRSTLLIVEVRGAQSRRRRAAAAAKASAPALAASVRAAEALAGEYSLEVEALRVSSARPVEALLGFVADRSPALVVFATDPAALRRFRRPTRRTHRRFVAALADGAQCLIWTAQEPDAGAAAAWAVSAAARRASRAMKGPMRGVRPGDALKMIKPPAAATAGC
jgi:hypothetical protein